MWPSGEGGFGGRRLFYRSAVDSAKKIPGSTVTALFVGFFMAAAVSVFPVLQGKSWEHYLVRLPNPMQTCATDHPFIIVIGQSQAANSGVSRHFGARGAQMFHDGSCRALRDPIAGATSNGSSVWPHFSQALGRPVVLLDAAVKGSAIEDWTAPASTNRRDFQADLRDATRQGLRPALVIWMQGEADVERKLSATQYARHLILLKKQIGVDARWLIVREGRCRALTQTQQLELGRQQAAKADRSFVLGPNLDDLGPEFRHDGCHFNPVGQGLVGSRLADAVRMLL
jgi:hypothetical protein